ncbi:MAG: GNAT family N-acetyltransferase [Chloroflexi bacterium]|nr:GNAT family N-acetyltransferase [Chloroflexota bacterium]
MFSLKVDEELSLVLAEDRHAGVMTDLIVRNQARLARWEPWAEHPATLEGTRTYIRAALEDFARGRQISTIMTITSGDEPRFIGRCGMRINPQLGHGDIGYWIDGDYESQGLTSRAARGLITATFDELRLNKVDLRTSVGNQRSRGLAERLGFTFEGILPRGLQFIHRADDVALYAVTAARWRELNAAAVTQTRR